MSLIITIIPIFILLIANEFWWRKRRIHSELSRKFIHITVGSYVAFWPYYLSWRQIELLGVAFILVVSLSKYLKLFKAIHSVQRPTQGELFFALSIVLIALLTKDKWIYTAAILQMAIADGLAGVIGEKYGKRQNYLVLNHTKSVIGTLTFFISSFLILIAVNSAEHLHLNLIWVVFVSAIASTLENFSALGLDNLLIPLAVALFLIYR